MVLSVSSMLFSANREKISASEYGLRLVLLTPGISPPIKVWAGAPKVRAMQIIDSLEPQRRNAWCGSIGYLSLCGNMDTSITIRTLTAWQGQLYCSAGGGIVADSEEDAEYQETFDKVNRILHQLES